VKLPPPIEHVVTARGSMDIHLLPGGVVVQRAVGHATKAVAEAVIRALDKALAENPSISLYNDWYASTGYDPEVRKMLTDFTIARRKRIAEVNILVGSRLVGMGVAVAGIVVSGMRTYTVPEEFERALAQAADLSRAPSSSPSALPRAGR
jgi:hypothetical protein